MIYTINLERLIQFFRQPSNTNSNPAQDSQNTKNTIHKNYRINILFAFTLFTLTLSLYFCWGIVINPQSNPDNIKFAFTLITAIISGLVGFITGKGVS